MGETKIPGICARHAVITPQCRKRGDAVVIREACERIREMYEGLAKHWGPDAIRCHVVLTVEKLPPPEEPSEAE